MENNEGGGEAIGVKGDGKKEGKGIAIMNINYLVTLDAYFIRPTCNKQY